MPRLRFRPLSAALLLLAFMAGSALLVYARLTQPLLDADRAAAAGQHEDALKAYQDSARRFDGSAVTRFLFSREHTLAVANHLALLYRAGDFNAVIDRAAVSPSAAAPHFWAGLALMQLGMSAGSEDAQLTWFSRAEEELRQALQSSPSDWDTKVNYEIAARILNEMRKQPKRRIENPMQLLRPQQAPTTPQRKAG